MYDPNSSPSSSSSTTSSEAPQPNPSSAAGPGPGPGANWRDQRDAWHAARRQWRHEHGGWGGAPVGAIVLIVLGVLFLLGNFGLQIAGNWWAALILVPAVGLLVAAIRFYRAEGPSPRVIGPAIGGVVLLAFALSLFFGFHGAHIVWPIVLIGLGAAFIARRSWGWRQPPPKA